MIWVVVQVVCSKHLCLSNPGPANHLIYLAIHLVCIYKINHKSARLNQCAPYQLSLYIQYEKHHQPMAFYVAIFMSPFLTNVKADKYWSFRQTYCTAPRPAQFGSTTSRMLSCASTIAAKFSLWLTVASNILSCFCKHAAKTSTSSSVVSQSERKMFQLIIRHTIFCIMNMLVCRQDCIWLLGGITDIVRTELYWMVEGTFITQNTAILRRHI